MMKLVYVFDYRDGNPESYVCRVPRFVARVLCKVPGTWWDYAVTPAGY